MVVELCYLDQSQYYQLPQEDCLGVLCLLNAYCTAVCHGGPSLALVYQPVSLGF